MLTRHAGEDSRYLLACDNALGALRNIVRLISASAPKRCTEMRPAMSFQHPEPGGSIVEKSF
jgi:hypothetical protein